VRKQTADILLLHKKYEQSAAAQSKIFIDSRPKNFVKLYTKSISRKFGQDFFKFSGPLWRWFTEISAFFPVRHEVLVVVLSKSAFLLNFF